MLYREAGQFKASYAEDQQIFPIRQDRIAVAILLVVAFLVVPLIANEYWLSAILVPLLIFALATLGLNLLTGYAGQLSLGTAAFMAVGAFAAYNFMLVLSIVALLALAAKNMTRSSIGRAWMAVRDMDVAAEVIGIRILYTKLLAFAISSFYCGIAGALYAFAYLGTVEPEGFNLDLSFRVLFMVIIGGAGSILGSFLGAAFIVLLPIFLNTIAHPLEVALGVQLPPGLMSNLELIVFGSLIVFFLIVEPHGLARLWQIGKEKLRLWPFPH